MWAGLLAGALNVMLQSLTGLDRQADTPGRMRIATLRQQLLAVPGRLISHARDLILRLPPDQRNRPAPLAVLRALPAPTCPPSPTPTSKDPETPTQTSGTSVRPHPPGRCSDRGHAARNKITALAADLGLTRLGHDARSEEGFDQG